MLERLGHFLVRRRWAVLVGTIVFIVASGAFGGSVEEHLFNGGFEEPDSESTRAAELLREEFGQAPPNFLLLVEAKEGTVNDAKTRKDGLRVTNELISEDNVGQVLSHFALGAKSPLQSRDSTKALIVAEIEGDEDAANEIAADLRSKYTVDWTNTRVQVGGFQAVFDEVSLQIQEDLQKGESIAGVVTLILLIVVFGSLIAAVLPLGIGIVSILGTFLVLRLLTEVTDVSVFALSMVTAMGLGLAIDYSLFIVSRFREELRAGRDTEDAVVITVQTAGRTIIFSAITVAIALSALLVFPLVFFRSFGYAGIGVVLTAMVGSVIFLPAALALLGSRVDKWALWKRHPKEVGEGVWHRMAMFVMRRPWPVAITVVVALLLLGVPFLHVNLGLPDERVLPPGAETRQVHDAIRSEFPNEEVNSLRVVLPEIGDPTKVKKEVANYAIGLSKIPNVGRVETLTGAYEDGKKVAGSNPFSVRFASDDSAWLQVIPSVDPMSQDGEAVAKQIRAAPAAFDDVIVGGASAQLVDVKKTMFAALPWAIAIIGVVTFILLFLMFGSLLVPAKALVLNLLSLTATFGAMVWIFQDGHLSGVLDFTSNGQLDISSPILMFCIAFGLSMDYEVFLLSRIKEEYDRTGDNVTSVAIGLERTGRIVTAAAVLISVVFLAIGASSVRFIKLFGIGMALAVLMDAFVIRGTLVPAFMRLAGRANWWLPTWLQGFQRRFAISESIEVDEPSGPQPSRPTTPRPASPPRKKAPARRPVARAKPARASVAKKKPSRTKAKAPAKRKPAARSKAKPAAKRKPSSAKRKSPAARKTPAKR